jgi:hypothetical protein
MQHYKRLRLTKEKTAPGPSAGTFVIIESALGKKCGLAFLKIPHFNLEM